LLPDEERAPLALPGVQRFRIYQELNNLRVLSRDLSDSPLSLEQRDELATLLEKGDLTFTKIRQALKLPGHSKFNIEDLRRDRLKGNATAVTMSKPELFGDQWRSLSHTQQDEIVTRVLEESSEATLIGWLTENAGISELSAQKVAQVRLPEGYGSLSQKAVALVLPELQKAVCTYDKAVLASGLGSHSELMAVQKDGELADELPYYGIPLQRHVGFGSGKIEDPPEKRYGRIANPTVHIGLNELRKVVNALIKRYGRPSEIIVEVARELKFGRERLRELELEQAARQKQNERLVQEACQITGDDPLTLSRGRRREYSQKMQLWEQLNPDVAARRCPYTGEQISITKLLSAEVEVDHILPYSQTLDDSMNNKTVAFRRANRDKGNRSPWQAFGAITEGVYDYAQILERAALMAPAKRARFAKDGLEKWLREDKDFLARALTDTAYLSRVAKEYLSLVVPPSAVRAIPGRMTALLRGKFGLNQLLSGSELKNRNDHRHHALDAAVVAVTDQGLLARFARASASAREAQLERLVEDMQIGRASCRERV
jgi:CRISPR-associated endonuclease Csn1